MRKASKILFLVGAILACVAAVFYLGSGIFLAVFPNTDLFAEAVKEAAKQNPDFPAEAEEALRIVLAFWAVCSFFEVALCGVSAFFGFKAYKEEKASKTLCILNIVFGALTVEVNLVGAIFGLIANGQDDRRAALEQKE